MNQLFLDSSHYWFILNNNYCKSIYNLDYEFDYKLNKKLDKVILSYKD